MGTPDFAARILQILYEGSRGGLTSPADIAADSYRIVAVFSRPDAVSKRGSKTTPAPVSQFAQQQDLLLYRPTTLRDGAVQAQLRDLQPDLIIVAAYGLILPKEVLEIPTLGCVNVHASLLPRWRGAAPIERAILAGDVRTGVSIMLMEEGLDTGPTCAMEATNVGEKTALQLRVELADIGGQLLLDVMPLLFSDVGVQWMVQDAEKVTYADKIEKSELLLSPKLRTIEFLRRVRASSESAPARLHVVGHVADHSSAVLEARALDFDSSALDGAEQANDVPEQLAECASMPAGQIKVVKHQGKRHALLSCTDGNVELLTVRPDNKRAMPAVDWLNGVAGAKQGLQWG